MALFYVLYDGEVASLVPVRFVCIDVAVVCCMLLFQLESGIVCDMCLFLAYIYI